MSVKVVLFAWSQRKNTVYLQSECRWMNVFTPVAITSLGIT